MNISKIDNARNALLLVFFSIIFVLINFICIFYARNRHFSAAPNEQQLRNQTGWRNRWSLAYLENPVWALDLCDKLLYVLIATYVGYISSLMYTVVVLIVWYLDLELPVQSVPFTTKVVGLNSVHGEVYLMQQYMIKIVSNLRQMAVFSGHSGLLYK